MNDPTSPVILPEAGSPTVLIIGAGLIGTSIGLVLSERGVPVYLTDDTPSHALVAESMGAGRAGVPDDARLVVVAVPPSAAGEVVVQALSDYPDATVTDVASVKVPVLEQVRAAGAYLARYVGSHPMAGSHRSGPLTARADLFVDRTWVVAAGPEAEPARVDEVQRLAKACGSRVETMDPAEHDLAVAQVSHVPQIVSSLMAGTLTDIGASHLRLAGQGVRDVTRVAASDPDMWTQIITANRHMIRDQLVAMAASLDHLAGHLDSEEVVADFIRDGVAGTRALPGKHGRTAKDYVYVVVEIPDSPGSLARLFADVGTAGVNVEDVSIEHDPDRVVGYLSMTVEPDKADALTAAMVDAGWRVRP